MEVLQTDETSTKAYEFAYNRHNTPEAAKKYNTRYKNHYKDAREKACVLKALSDVPCNSTVLDLPCGTGRLSYLIRDRGFRLIGADCSEHMLKEAQKKLKKKGNKNISFETQDIFHIQYAENHFGAVVCNRLFHHFPTKVMREAALKELARVSSGPLIISFYHRYSLSALWRGLKRGLKINDQYHIYLSFREFEREIKCCGLKVVARFYVRRGVSSQVYVKAIDPDRQQA